MTTPTDAQLDALWAEACKRDQPTRDMVRAFARAAIALAQPVPDPLFLLHCGQIDSSGEQDDWDCEADSGKRVEDFCRQHPGKTIPLYTAAHPQQPAGVAAPTTDQSQPQR
jgi:hypothetical protein